MKIKKGDNVIVIAGKEKGKKGLISRALPRESAVIIDGFNLKKKHRRARKSGQKGEVIELAAPIHVSNVQLVDGKGKPVRARKA